jgi:tetratricopeptide (TPR) repeat protein
MGLTRASARASVAASSGTGTGPAARLGDRLRPHLREQDLGRAGIALALALLTVLAAIVAGLQSHASTLAQQGRREADRIGLEATGQDGSSVVRVGTAYGVYRRWFEQLERSNWAQDAITRDPEGLDVTLLETLRDVDTAIAEWATQQTSLLQAPYFNAVTRLGDFGGFEADRLHGPATRAAQLRDVEAAVAAGWDSKASDYITVLTVLAVGLFFLGLGSTVGRRARRFLATAGASFGVVALGWTLAIALGPIHRVPAAAVERVVESAAHQFRAGGSSPGSVVSAAYRAEFQRGIETAGDAIGLDPSYIAAYQVRANARLVYADTLIFSPEGQSDATTTLLRDAVTDYRAYLAGRPDDYSGWWNLGWAAYLQGDVVGSIEATNRAIELAPTQFTLYLNRTLALLAARDQAAALADVAAAIDLAARDSSDSATWYLGQSDFNIGRLATLRPESGETLRAIQRELREAQVALRVLGVPRPPDAAPELGAVTVRPIEVGRYSGGTINELEPLAAGDSLEAPEAVGLRITVAGTAALAGRTLSARLWVDGQPRSDYRVDQSLGPAPGESTSLELVNPYGRAGFDLDAGAYELQLFVDGATRFSLAWTVTPRPSEPQYATTAGGFLERIAVDGFACDPPAPEGDGRKSICSATEAGTQFLVNLTYDAQDRITVVVLGANAGSDTADIRAQAQLFFSYAIRILYPPELAERADAWLREQDTAVNDVEIGGTTIRVYGATDTVRNLDIWSPWPVE